MKYVAKIKATNVDDEARRKVLYLKLMSVEKYFKSVNNQHISGNSNLYNDQIHVLFKSSKINNED